MPGGRAGMLPRQQLATENVGGTMYRPYAPTGAVSHDDDDSEPALCNGRIYFDVTVYILGHY